MESAPPTPDFNQTTSSSIGVTASSSAIDKPIHTNSGSFHETTDGNRRSNVKPGSKSGKFIKNSGSFSNVTSLSDGDQKSDVSDEREKSKSKSKSSSKKKKGLFGHASGSSSESVSREKGDTEIEDKHPEFEVTYDMMLGIRTVIGMAYNHPPREITKEDFEFVGKYSFPKAGSSKTPAHKARDFRFKDYHPEVFRRIRERFGIDAMEYTMTVTNNHYLEFIANSKSGQFFFYTHNKQFMIKTMSKEECKFIRKILPHYYEYVMENQSTLLTRYYGIHRVKPSGGKKMRFLIMGSVFFTDRFIHELYDLKGSTHGRSATEREKRQAVPVFKDLDFRERGLKIRLARDKAESLIEQIEKDTQFLHKRNIMDYSMLLGLHYMEREPADDVKEENCSVDVASPDELESYLSGDLTKAGPLPARRQSHYGLTGAQELITARNDYSSALPLVTEEVKKKRKSAIVNTSGSIFCADDGGIRGVNADGTPSQVIYYMGIIDILQQYNTKKKLERTVKSISSDVNTISSIKPSKYATRFTKFIANAVDLTATFAEHESDDDPVDAGDD